MCHSVATFCGRIDDFLNIRASINAQIKPFEYIFGIIELCNPVLTYSRSILSDNLEMSKKKSCQPLISTILANSELSH